MRFVNVWLCKLGWHRWQWVPVFFRLSHSTTRMEVRWCPHCKGVPQPDFKEMMTTAALLKVQPSSGHILA